MLKRSISLSVVVAILVAALALVAAGPAAACYVGDCEYCKFIWFIGWECMPAWAPNVGQCHCYLIEDGANCAMDGMFCSKIIVWG